MAMLSINELKTLVENPQSPCVSLYMPMQKAGTEIRQNPIRFKNLIREAEQRLDDLGMRHAQVVDFLEPARELDSNNFWEHQDHGLVIFVSPNVFRYYCLPMEFTELVVVSNQFHLKPLLHLIQNDGQFYVLALSQKDVKFFEGTRYDINQVEIENLPKSMADVLQEDDIQKGVQHRIATSQGGTGNSFQQPGQFHGQGSPDRDKRQEDILQFCHAVNGALHEKLREQTVPLVLAGVEYLFPIYREANTYSYLTAEGISGNPEVIQPQALQEQAWQIVEPLFHQSEQDAIALYQQLAGEDTGKAVSDVKEIINAAYYQRIDALFVAVGQQIWGKFHVDTMSLDLHSEPEPDDEDMLDFAAIHTLLNGGTVYALQPEEMPNQVLTAAIFRY
ncbi:hypothetical protein [Fortiea contorta]|uniref:baeRF7 domain-containing protein n=1 Tax=Fortiea contorta TaxID=1892405 RepID=UPI00034D401B|nr:hypothetical protein [Fortiea contorta]